MSAYTAYHKYQLIEALNKARSLVDDTLDNVDLGDVSYPGIRFEKTTCTNSRFQGADFSGADVLHSTFRGVVLRAVSLKQAGLEWSHFLGSDLIELAGDESTFYKTRVEGCSLMKSSMKGARLLQCKFLNTDFHSADFSGSFWLHSRVSDEHLGNASLVRSKFCGAVLTDVSMKGCNFANADLSGAMFVHVDLDGANFKEAVLRDVSFYGCRAEYATFDQADLTGSRSLLTDFRTASFQGAEKPVAVSGEE